MLPMFGIKLYGMLVNAGIWDTYKKTSCLRDPIESGIGPLKLQPTRILHA